MASTELKETMMHSIHPVIYSSNFTFITSLLDGTLMTGMPSTERLWPLNPWP